MPNCSHLPSRKFIAGEPIKLATKRFARFVEELARGAYLFNKPFVHNDNTIGQGHCFDLIMGNIYCSDAEGLVQLLDFAAHLHPKFGIKVG